MFEIDRFIDDCKQAVTSGGGQTAVRELVERAVSDPSALTAALGEPQRAGVQKLHVADDLTILHLLWGPQMVLMPHNHEMWATIGIYTGREDNIFWQRIPGEENGKLKAASVRSLAAGDVAALGPDVIHSVLNPVNRLTGAIHVYGGDFFQTPRSEWDPESLLEGTYDVAKNMQLFEDANHRLAAQ